jgi:hypothetical protein
MRERTRLATDLQLMYVMVNHQIHSKKRVLAINTNFAFEPVGWMFLDDAQIAKLLAECCLLYSIDDTYPQHLLGASKIGFFYKIRVDLRV